MIISNRVTNTTVTTILRSNTSHVITNAIANTIACQGPKKKAKSVIIESQNYTYVQLYAENARDQW